MKKIFFAVLAVATIFSSCSSQDPEIRDGKELKSLEFALGIATPATRMGDGTVTNSVIAAVRANIETITIEYFNSANATLGSYTLTPEQVAIVKSDDQTQADAARTSVRINNLPAATAKVNVYLNVKTSGDINDLQTSYNVMEYRGKDAVAITLKTAGGGTNGNDLYEVEVPVQPVLARFEFKGSVNDFIINKDGDSNLPAGITDGTKADAQLHVSDAIIALAEAAAKDAWKAKNPGATEPTDWEFKYTVTYAYNTAYTITGIDGYYMNNIPLTKTGALVLNTNNAAGDWDDAAKANYNASTGGMKKMFDVTTPAAGQNIAYNLFPQTFTPATAGNPTLSEVKANMPHFILKLATSEGTRWLTIRALRSTAAGSPLISAFEAKKAYVLNASEIHINQYSAKLVVTAKGEAGPEIPEVIDPIDPNPEPRGKDLDLRVEILDWDIVYVKPEA